MKRLLSGIIILLISIVTGIYIFIPSTLTISVQKKVALNNETAFRVINNKMLWQQWVDSIAYDTSGNLVGASFLVNGKQFGIEAQQYNAFATSVMVNGQPSPGRLAILPITTDTIYLVSQYEIPADGNPFERVKQYKAAASIKAANERLLGTMAAFLNDQQRLYGHSFKVGSTNDTLLIALRSEYTTMPGTTEIYTGVQTLQQYAQQNGARQTAPPMVNLTPMNAGKTELMVALPVNKMLPDNGRIIYRKLVPGNFLIAEVKGGQATVNNAFGMMHQYITDEHKTIMAIPFQVLLTDRSKEPDSSKWMTRLYYPILN